MFVYDLNGIIGLTDTYIFYWTIKKFGLRTWGTKEPFGSRVITHKPYRFASQVEVQSPAQNHIFPKHNQCFLYFKPIIIKLVDLLS